MLVMECPLDRLPVIDQETPAFLNRSVTSFAVVLGPRQQLLRRQQLVLIDVLIKAAFRYVLLIQGAL